MQKLKTSTTSKIYPRLFSLVLVSLYTYACIYIHTHTRITTFSAVKRKRAEEKKASAAKRGKNKAAEPEMTPEQIGMCI